MPIWGWDELSVLNVQKVVAGYVAELDILKGVSVRVEKGQTVCIIGPNGAGKSTLIKTIFGLLPPREGSIRFQGEEIGGLRPETVVEKGMAYVPQLGNVFPSMTVDENLEMGAWTRRDGVQEAKDRVFEMFPVLSKRRRQRAGTMSGGERQMVAMARALMVDPVLLLLDEPSAGLAPAVVEEVFINIRRIAQEGIPILLVEQNAKKALGYSDYAYVLDVGRNRFEGSGQELLENPEVGRLYLGG
jgi:neutral amino acid transport system ATP-binding protein